MSWRPEVRALLDAARLDPSLAPLGLGTAPLGMRPDRVDDAAAHETLSAAWGFGVRHFDTAPYYGAGLAEIRLGRFLAEVPRSQVVITSKVGRRVTRRGTPDSPGSTEFAFGADDVRRQLDEIFARLGVDRLDAVFLHDADDHWEIAMREAWPVLRRWRDEGVVGAIGVGMNQVALPMRLVKEQDPDVVLLANRHTLLEPLGALNFLAECAARDVAVVLGGVFNSGILASGPVGGARYNYADAPAEVVSRARLLQAACADAGVSLGAAALRFAAAGEAVSLVLMGCESPAQVAQNLAWARTPVPRSLLRSLTT